MLGDGIVSLFESGLLPFVAAIISRLSNSLGRSPRRFTDPFIVTYVLI
jgi:hypothetical protein